MASSATSTIPAPFLELLRGPTLRIRTGLWLLPPQALDEAPNEAARVGMDSVDMRQEWLVAMPPTTQFVRLDPASLLKRLDEVAALPLAGGCGLIINLDLLLARLTLAQREDVWSFLFQHFSHRKSAILLAMPETATALLPQATELERWQEAGRLCSKYEFL